MSISTPTSISIRRARPEDAPALARMRWDDSMEGEDDPAPLDAGFVSGFADFVRSALAGDQWVIWVAEADGRLLAHLYIHLVGMVPRPGRFARRWGYATAVYTLPEARNRGIGSRLLRHVIDWAKEENLEFLLLWPSERSVPFYQRAGFLRSPDALELELRPDS